MENPNEIIKACPICGRPIEHHCWHEEHEIGSVQMTKSDAACLMTKTLRHMRMELELFERSLSNLESS